MTQEKSSNLLDTIRSRRSIRKYTGDPVSDLMINDILEAGRWAPSGLNNQPWRFIVIKDNSVKEKLSDMTNYTRIIRDSDFCIAVFYNGAAGYHRDKDIMSIGASIQNMLLYSHSIGIGSVWLGEILKNRDRVEKLLGSGDDNEFLALIAFGHPGEDTSGNRKKMNEILLKVI